MDIVLAGPHGAGKTTLGLGLAQELGVEFQPEIGRQLAEDRHWRPAGCDASMAQLGFDLEVVRRELRRDAAWPCDRLRVVETWHPGNLAYLLARSPALATWAIPQMVAACRRRPSLVVMVDCADDVLKCRQSEPGERRFFTAVGRDARRCAQLLGLPVALTVDGTATLEQSVGHVVAAITQMQSRLTKKAA